MLVVILHQRLLPKRCAFLGVPEPLRDLILDIEMEGVGGAARGVMQVGAQSQEKIVGGFDSPLIGFAQPILADQVRSRERPFPKKCHPKQVLVVAQSAAPALQMWFLHVNGVAELRVSRRLILHSQLNVFSFTSADASLPKCRPEFISEVRIASEGARLQHGCFRKHVLVGQLDRFRNRTGRMADFETNVPQQVEGLFDDLGGVIRNLSAVFVVEEHDVDVAEWIELPASVAAKGNDRERGGERAFAALCKTDGGREDMLEEDVDQFHAKSADFAATSSVLVAEKKAVLLDFQELFIERQRFRRPHRPSRGQLTLGVGQDFPEMSRGGHSVESQMERCLCQAPVFLVKSVAQAPLHQSSIA